MKSVCLTLVSLLAVATAQAQTNEGLGIPVRPEKPAQVEATKLSKIPKQIKFVEAPYPKDAQDKGVEADVVLLLNITDKGTIESVGIAEPATPAGLGFDEAALLAAQDFEFEPAEIDGKAIAVQITYKYKFRLKPKPVDPAPTPAPAAVGETAATAPAATPKKDPVVNLSGALRERGTRLPLSGVVVTVFRDDGGKAVGFEASADATGTFRFFDLAPGDWKILIDAPGYYPYRTTEAIRAGEAVNVTYFVERGSYNPFDVTVTATRPRKEVSRTVIGVKEIDTVPGTFGDPLAVIQNFAGVARAPVNGLLIVRGSAPEDTQVFVDGAEVPIIYHFGGLRSVIPIGMLESIEFYPGNFSPQYGRATGGIIDVQLKKVQPKKIGGYADVSILDTSLFLEAPFGNKGGIAIGARRSYLDFILNALVPDDADVGLVAAPRYYDFQILANYRPSAAHDFRAFFLMSDDRLKLLFKNPADISTDLTSSEFGSSTTFYRSLLTYKYIPSATFENTLRVSQGRNWIAFKAGQLNFDLNFYTTQIRDTARKTFSDKLALTLGTDTTFSKSDVDIQLPRPPKEGEPDGNFDFGNLVFTKEVGRLYFSPAVFTELEAKPVPGLLLLPGVRVDHFTRIHQTIVQPRFTARYQLSDPFTIKGGVGLFVQEPEFEETNREFGNPKLKAERALHYSFGGEFKPRPHLTFDITGFYKQLSSLVSKAKDPGLIYDNRGRGTVIGMEAIIRHEFHKNFSGWVAYTLSQAKRRDSGADSTRLFDFDQTHILTMVGSYLLPRNWQVGGRFRLVSGNPRTPVIGSTYNSISNRYDPINGGVNTARNGLFHQLDVRIDKRWIYQNWMLNLYLDVQNIYSHDNPEGLSYNYDYSKNKAQSGLPILTILGIRAEF